MAFDTTVHGYNAIESQYYTLNGKVGQGVYCLVKMIARDWETGTSAVE